MALKPRGTLPDVPHKESKALPDPAAVAAIVDAMAERPYGEKKAPVEKARPLTISLQPAMIRQLEDRALKNKRERNGEPKTASGLIKQALQRDGFTDFDM